MLVKTYLRRPMTHALLVAMIFSIFVFIYCNDSRISHSSNAVHSFGRLVELEDGAPYNITGIVFDTENTNIDVGICAGDFNLSEYLIRIGMLQSNFDEQTCQALLLNSRGTDTLWEYIFTININNIPQWIRIQEIADGDTLDFLLSEVGDLIYEDYYQNGESLSLCYDSKLVAGLSGETRGYSSDDLSRIDSLRMTFVNFYNNNLMINANPYGDLLTYFLVNEDFWNYIFERAEETTHRPPPDNLRTDVADLCNVFGLMASKCYICRRIIQYV